MNQIPIKNILITTAVCLILLAGLMYFTRPHAINLALPQNVANPLSTNTDANSTSTGDIYQSESTARDIVVSFGTELQKVPLLAPNAAASMEEFYGQYVSPELLRQWEQDPLHAPGKTTSSPWPDHIEISDVEKTPTGFIVRGQLVYMTSNEIENGGTAGVQDVTITLTNINGTLLISGYVAGQVGQSGSS